ncbi:MAG: TetR family transcriptional regulator C-terminal domain-containing protein [Pseudomonadota bacterium]
MNAIATTICAHPGMRKVFLSAQTNLDDALGQMCQKPVPDLQKDRGMAALSEIKKPRKERKENADRRRRQLLDAARRSVLRHGLAKTTLATVAAEAGLSQGVAVFYFKSKSGLLTETLRDVYQTYETLWRAAIATTGTPSERLMAVLEADFCEESCGPEQLPLWFAFWGELRFSEHYADLADAFDARRQVAMLALWREVLPDASEAEITKITDWMETLTDGYWISLHLTPDALTRKDALAATQSLLRRVVPGVV